MNTEMYAELAGTPQAARQARQLIRHMLGENHPSAGDAALVASELVGNAVAHTRSGQPGGTLILSVELTEQPSSVCIRVRDAGSPSAPTLTAADLDREHGRGLAIVAALAADWGSERTGPGRATWCRLANPASAGNSQRLPRPAIPRDHVTATQPASDGPARRTPRSVTAQRANAEAVSQLIRPPGAPPMSPSRASLDRLLASRLLYLAHESGATGIVHHRNAIKSPTQRELEAGQ